MTKIYLLPVLLLTIAACAPLPMSRDAPRSSGDPTISSPSEPAPAPARGPSTVLLEQSRAHQAAAEYPEAAAALERAVRIAPGDPVLWLELARVHFAAGNLQQAAAHARKSLSLAGGDAGTGAAAQDLLDRIAAR